MRSWSHRLFHLLLWLSLGLVGCAPSEEPMEISLQPVPVSTPVAREVRVKVYWDTSGTMKKFMGSQRDPKDSFLDTLWNEFDRRLATKMSWSSTQIQHYTVGNSLVAWTEIGDARPSFSEQRSNLPQAAFSMGRSVADGNATLAVLISDLIVELPETEQGILGACGEVRYPRERFAPQLFWECLEAGLEEGTLRRPDEAPDYALAALRHELQTLEMGAAKRALYALSFARSSSLQEAFSSTFTEVFADFNVQAIRLGGGSAPDPAFLTVSEAGEPPSSRIATTRKNGVLWCLRNGDATRQVQASVDEEAAKVVGFFGQSQFGLTNVPDPCVTFDPERGLVTLNCTEVRSSSSPGETQRVFGRVTVNRLPFLNDLAQVFPGEQREQDDYLLLYFLAMRAPAILPPANYSMSLTTYQSD